MELRNNPAFPSNFLLKLSKMLKTIRRYLFNMLGNIPSLPEELLDKVNIVAIMNPPCLGVRIGKEFLFINQRQRSSFRTKAQNIGRAKRIVFIQHTGEYPDEESIREYFELNQDNPYAVQLFHQVISSNRKFNPKTQYPPLLFHKTKEQQAAAIEKIKLLAKPGDLIFTFNRSSLINWIIRHIDYGHWAHQGIIGPKGTLIEMTTKGMQDNNLDVLKNPDLDVGLYRLSNIDPKLGVKAALNAESLSRRSIRYNYRGIIKIFLKKFLRLKFIKHGPTMNTYMSSQQIELIAYA